MSGVRRQSERIPLRPVDMRVMQRLLQAHRPEQEAVFVCGQTNLSNRQTAAKEMRLLSFSKVSSSWHETGSGARKPGPWWA